MMAALRNRDDGFTLTELLIAMAIGIVVFGTAGTTLVAYQNDAARSTRAIDSQEGAGSRSTGSFTSSATSPARVRIRRWSRWPGRTTWSSRRSPHRPADRPTRWA